MQELGNAESNYLRPTPRVNVRLRPWRGTLARLKSSVRPCHFASAFLGSAAAVATSFAAVATISTLGAILIGPLRKGEQYIVYCMLAALMILTISAILSVWNARATAIAEDSSWFRFGRNWRRLLATSLLVSAIGCIGPLLLTAEVFRYFSQSIWNGTHTYIWTLYFLMYPSFFLGYTPFALAPAIAAREGVSPFEALARSLKLTAGHRISMGLWLMLSHLLALTSYVCFVLPGLILFHWNAGILNNLYESLKEPEQAPTPLQQNAQSAEAKRASVSA